jgi:hypothetical protein
MSKENYYVNPVEFKNSLKRFYETDVITDDLADNVNKILAKVNVLVSQK